MLAKFPIPTTAKTCVPLIPTTMHWHLALVSLAAEWARPPRSVYGIHYSIAPRTLGSYDIYEANLWYMSPHKNKFSTLRIQQHSSLIIERCSFIRSNIQIWPYQYANRFDKGYLYSFVHYASLSIRSLSAWSSAMMYQTMLLTYLQIPQFGQSMQLDDQRYAN